MSVPAVVEDVVRNLQRRFGKRAQVGRSHRLWKFGEALTCSINYSKLLRGHKFFFGLSREVADKNYSYPETEFGDFVLLVCGTPEQVLVLPRSLVLQMLKDVPTRKLDVFCEEGTYILQTTQHPKLNVTEHLNAYPRPRSDAGETSDDALESPTMDRDHVKYQSALIDLGAAEGCSVWVPVNDRGLSYRGHRFSARTLERLPNFGFDENTRRIVHNIDVLWLSRNLIRKAFEIEATTQIYSGLLRLNDLVLSQPHSSIDLYIVASRSRRQKVHNQLVRPSFQSLIPHCEFFAFEDVDEQLEKIKGIPVDRGARVSGLVKGERFSLPDGNVYPSGI
jgi:hypothetical protein